MLREIIVFYSDNILWKSANSFKTYDRDKHNHTHMDVLQLAKISHKNQGR
jgi:hypothetical protein